MTKKQQEGASDETEAEAPVEVRALCDLPSHGGIAGRLVLVPSGQVPGMRAAGLVDDSEAAIAYARSLEHPAD
jgi:hypothetical protein